MGKILGKAGETLSDVYDVQGSVVGVERLLSEDVNLVHEMGGTLFSERIGGSIIAFSPGQVAQSTDFDIGLTLATSGPAARLLGAAVFVNTSARMTRVQLSISSPIPITDHVILVWDVTGGSARELVTRMIINGSAVARQLLDPDYGPFVPNLLISTDQRLPAPTVNMRGRTSAFGAGTVTPECILYFAQAEVGGLSSKGLPLPGW